MNDPNPSTAPVRVVESESGVVIEVTIAAPVATVWPHLRDSELIGRWHGWDDVTLADEIDFIYQQQMREGEQPYTLETRGGPAPGSFDLGDRFDLRESGAATIVRITRAPKGSGGEWDAMYDDITQGWIFFLAQLRFAVEEQPNAARRTVFLASGPSPAARALLDVADLAPGDDYAIAPVTGLEPSGTAWFRTDGQTGLTVADYGPGLVVLADKPGAEPGSAESSMAIVSTFGLDDAAFAAVEAAWQRWWADTHPA